MSRLTVRRAVRVFFAITFNTFFAEYGQASLLIHSMFPTAQKPVTEKQILRLSVNC